MKQLIIIGIIFLIIITIAAGLYFYFSSTYRGADRFVTRYPYVTVENLWIAYKRNEIQQDGRTVDRSLNFLTTSEGQSYSLLRALWMDDKEVFDQVLRWTENNLQKRDDNLFSWKWGQKEDGTWGVLTEEGGGNSATDADLDIALALIMANKRWNQEHYLEEAKRILNDVWNREVVTVNGRPYLVAGDWAQSEEYPTINPSYFNFAGYDVFAEVDPVHNWQALKDTSYEVLNAGTGILPPDWVSLNPTTGEIIEITVEGKTGDFADDAVRVPWRVSMDWKWNRDPRALAYLERLSFLKDEWMNRHAIFKSYSSTGEVLSNEESLSTYGALLPYFQIIDPELAEQIYIEKLAKYYDPDTLDFRGDIGYYSKNWAWFGMAFYEDKVPNIYQDWKEML